MFTIPAAARLRRRWASIWQEIFLKAIQPDSGEDLTIEAGVSRTQVWQRADLTAAESDWLADEVPVALVYNGISHVVMMTTPLEPRAP